MDSASLEALIEKALQAADEAKGQAIRDHQRKKSDTVGHYNIFDLAKPLSAAKVAEHRPRPDYRRRSTT